MKNGGCRVLTTTYDFSSPTFAKPGDKRRMAKAGRHWTRPTDLDLSSYYAGFPPFYFAKSEGVQRAKVYLDDGIVSEFKSRSTDNYESFGLVVELPDGLHDNTIYLLVEFDVLEAEDHGLPFQGVIAAKATTADLKGGVAGYEDKKIVATCQIRYDGAAAHSGGPKFRLNAPDTTGGGSFPFKPFDFVRAHFQHPIPPVSDEPAFANNSTFPLRLEIRIRASAAGSTQPATVDVALSQMDGAGGQVFTNADGTHIFDCVDPNDDVTDSLAAFKWVGFDMTITKPPGAVGVIDRGPMRARVKSLTVDYA